MKHTKWPTSITVFGRRMKRMRWCDSLWSCPGVLGAAYPQRDGGVTFSLSVGALRTIGNGPTLPIAIADAESKFEAEWARIGERIGYEIEQ